MTDPTIELKASPPRRFIAAFVLFVTGALLLWIAMTSPPASVGWLIFLLVIGGVILWAAMRLWQATASTMTLTDEALVDSSGTVLCHIDNMRAVERGIFAFKPSNGFLIRMHKPVGKGWAPGMWWRFGTRLGVGGVTPSAQAKAMADIIALRLSGAGDVLKD